MNAKLLVKKILENYGGYSWSLQGLGMLRLSLSREVRMHVWDAQFAVPDVSTIHDHPWDFFSEVVVGRVTDYVYEEQDPSFMGFPEDCFNKQTIVCGPGGCAVGKPEPAVLKLVREDHLMAGDSYHRRRDAIHRSSPERGTVTLVTRTFHEDTEHAHVFWQGERWVSAEPRPATTEEVRAITTNALERWFS